MLQMQLTFNQHLLQQHLQNHWTIAYWGAPTHEKIRNWAFAVSHCKWCFLSTSLVGTARTILSYIVWLRIEDYWLFQHPLQSANDILVHIMHAISLRPTSQRNLRTSSTAWRPHKKTRWEWCWWILFKIWSIQFRSAFKRLNSSDSRQSADKRFSYVWHFHVR